MSVPHGAGTQAGERRAAPAPHKCVWTSAGLRNPIRAPLPSPHLLPGPCLLSPSSSPPLGRWIGLNGVPPAPVLVKWRSAWVGVWYSGGDRRGEQQRRGTAHPGMAGSRQQLEGALRVLPLSAHRTGPPAPSSWAAASRWARISPKPPGPSHSLRLALAIRAPKLLGLYFAKSWRLLVTFWSLSGLKDSVREGLSPDPRARVFAVPLSPPRVRSWPHFGPHLWCLHSLRNYAVRAPRVQIHGALWETPLTA